MGESKSKAAQDQAEARAEFQVSPTANEPGRNCAYRVGPDPVASPQAAYHGAAADAMVTGILTYRTGDAVEYYSTTHSTWLPAVVTDMDREGRIIIDVKPNTWIDKEQQSQFI